MTQNYAPKSLCYEYPHQSSLPKEKVKNVLLQLKEYVELALIMQIKCDLELDLDNHVQNIFFL